MQNGTYRSFVVVTTNELMSTGLDVGSITHIGNHVHALASDFQLRKNRLESVAPYTPHPYPSETSLKAFGHSNTAVQDNSLVISTNVQVCLQIQDLSTTT